MVDVQAMFYISIGNYLLSRNNGRHAVDVEQALIFGGFALSLKDKIQSVRVKAATDAFLALAWGHRQQGDFTRNIEQMMRHSISALEIMPVEVDREVGALLHLNLGGAYAWRVHEDNIRDFESAVEHIQLALDVFSRETHTEKWALAQANLARAHLKRADNGFKENYAYAIQHCRAALEVATREAHPEVWSAAHHNLGLAQAMVSSEEPTENQEKALWHLTQALEAYHQNDSRYWSLLNDIGIFYQNRLKGDHIDNIDHSIEYLKRATDACTPETSPVIWASVQTNLAAGYLSSVRRPLSKHRELSIQHSHRALEVFTRHAFPRQWARTHINIAAAYADLVSLRQPDALASAIRHSRQALEVLSREREPGLWALIHRTLAHALHASANHHASPRLHAKTLQRARIHYRKALRVVTRNSDPIAWGAIQADLAMAFADGAVRGNRFNHERALRQFELALQVITRDSSPRGNRTIQRAIAVLEVAARNWSAALDASLCAIEAGDDLLRAAYTEIGQNNEKDEKRDIFTIAAYCLTELGQMGRALELLDRGKAITLSEEFALDSYDLTVVPDNLRAQLHSLRDELRSLQHEYRLPSDAPARRSERALVGLLQDRRAKLKSMSDVLRGAFKGFAHEDLTISEILNSIPPDGALVAPIVTDGGGKVFVIPGGVTELEQHHVIELEQLTTSRVQELLIGNRDRPGWIEGNVAGQHSGDKMVWRAQILQTTGDLWGLLVGPIVVRLQTMRVRHVLLIPTSGLQALPLHAAWSSDGGKRRAWLDYQSITYSPSIFTHRIAAHRALQRTLSSAVVVGVSEYINQPVLTHATAEAAVVAGLLGTTALCNEAATSEVLSARLEQAAYVHLSCHGAFDWLSPMNSALHLSNGTQLSLRDVFGLRGLHQTRLVTLSACETGIGDPLTSPDENIGLPAGFLQAGASAVVGSLWTVDDRCTALLMERFYRHHIDDGMSIAAALRAAQLWLKDSTAKELADLYKMKIASAEPLLATQAYIAHQELSMQWAPSARPYADPFYWAAFTHHGA